MKKIYTLPFVLLVLTSCGITLNYLGNSLPETEQVEVFVDPSAINKPYTIIGKAYVDYPTWVKHGIEKMQKKVVQKAKEKGADAVFFEDYYLLHNGTSIRTTSQIDTITNVTTGSATISPLISSGRNILFLKYK